MLEAKAEGYTAADLGPLVELVCVTQAFATVAAADVCRVVAGCDGLEEILPRLLSSLPDRPSGGVSLAGYHGMSADGDGAEERWVSFLMNARRAATAAGFPHRQGGQMVAAMRELGSNVAEHSGDASSGLAAYKASPPGRFEFAVVDRGCGVLESLRTSADYAGLRTHAQALQLALAEGESRRGRGAGHGNGFRPIFAGLADMNGHLRFRSGNHALSIDGRFDLARATLAQKAPLPGFIATVSCTA